MKSLFIFLLCILSVFSFAQSDSLPANDSISHLQIRLLPLDTAHRIVYKQKPAWADFSYTFKDSNKYEFYFYQRVDTIYSQVYKRTYFFDSLNNYIFSGYSAFDYTIHSPSDSLIALKSFYFGGFYIDMRIDRTDKESLKVDTLESIKEETYMQIIEKQPLYAFKDTNNIIVWSKDKFAQITFEHFDTTLRGFQIYNPALRNDYTISYLGNIGQPSFNRRFNNKKFTFLQAYDHLFYTSELTRYYNTKSPLTSLAYTMGPNKEQTLEAFHTQNINKYWNVGIRFHNIGSEGLITQQNVNGNRLNAFSSFNTNRYDAYFSFTRNRFDFLENGGIVDDNYLIDSLDLSDDVDDLNQIPIHLENARTDFLRNELSFYHEYKLGKERTYRLNDTTVQSFYRSPVSIAHFYKRYNYYRKYIDYEDTTSFYTNIYNNSNTFDSVYYRNRLHGGGVKLNDINIGRNLLNAGLFYQQRKEIYAFFNKDTLFNNSRDTNIYSAELEALFSFAFHRKYALDVFAQYVVEGYYKGNLKSSLSFSRYFREKDTSKLQLKLDYTINRPDYFLSNYASNHFKWTNNLAKYNLWETKVSLDYHKPKWLLHARISAALYDNSIYFDTNSYPQLSDTSFFVYAFELHKTFNFWKIVSDNKLLYQLSENTSTIAIPAISYYNSTYFNDIIYFKMTGGKLGVQLGFDLYYNSLFYSPAYMPATGQFYQQRRKEYGNYPIVDVFLNVKIKRMRIFLKMRHVNEGYLERNYFATKNYPYYGSGFVVGFNWGFYD